MFERFISWIKNIFTKDVKNEWPEIERNPIDEAIERGPKPIDPIGSGARKEIADFRFVDSSHHHSIFDIKAYSKACRLLINKCTQGTGFVDSTHKSRQKACKENGVLYGGYHFYECSKDPIEQAQFYFKTHGEFVIPPILDYELLSGQDESVLRKHKENAFKFMVEIERLTGKKPWIYTGYSLAKEINFEEKWGQFFLWVPRYSSSLGAIPAPWNEKTLAAWQFTESGVFPGFRSSNDVNIYYGKVNALNLK